MIGAIGDFLKNPKENLKFLVPLFAGFGVGVIIFSKVVDFLLENYEMYTRFAFLGLVLGTIPLFYREVKKEGFNKKYYIAIAGAFLFGMFLFTFNKNLFPKVTDPNLFQSVLLGVAVAGSSIVPGVDSAVILSTLGLYELYVGSLADFNISILVPALIGLVAGALVISVLMNNLIKKHYTITFSIIFGLFLSIIPNVLNSSCVIGFNVQTLISAVIFAFAFFVSITLGKIGEDNSLIDKIKSRIGKIIKLNKAEKENVK